MDVFNTGAMRDRREWLSPPDQKTLRNTHLLLSLPVSRQVLRRPQTHNYATRRIQTWRALFGGVESPRPGATVLWYKDQLSFRGPRPVLMEKSAVVLVFADVSTSERDEALALMRSSGRLQVFSARIVK